MNKANTTFRVIERAKKFVNRIRALVWSLRLKFGEISDYHSLSVSDFTFKFWIVWNETRRFCCARQTLNVEANSKAFERWRRRRRRRRAQWQRAHRREEKRRGNKRKIKSPQPTTTSNGYCLSFFYYSALSFSAFTPFAERSCCLGQDWSV